MATVHFLLVYDLNEQRLIRQQAFDDVTQATAAYSELEAAHGSDPNVEIVLVGADSIETIMKTHGQYFERVEKQSPYLVTA